MKNLYKLFALSFIVAFAFSCKDDELPLPVADFTTDPGVPEVGVPIMFENLTLNAASYIWDFGDDSDPVADISPSHTYDEAGTYTVVLTATTQDGQSIPFAQEIDVKERLLTGFIVNAFPTMNGDVEWDPLETNPDSVFADIMVVIANAESGIRIGPAEEIAEAPFSADLSSADIILTNEEWQFNLYDFDGADIDNPDFNSDTEFEGVFGITFNPVTAPSIKSTDQESGYIPISIADNDGNILDVDIYFELQ